MNRADFVKGSPVRSVFVRSIDKGTSSLFITYKEEACAMLAGRSQPFCFTGVEGLDWHTIKNVQVYNFGP